jgi:hypothetical protein
MMNETKGTPDEWHEGPGVGDAAITPRRNRVATKPGVSGSSKRTSRHHFFKLRHPDSRKKQATREINIV